MLSKLTGVFKSLTGLSLDVSKLAGYRKAVAAGLGSLLQVLVFTGQFSDVLPPAVGTAVGVAVAVLTPVVTYLLPNKPVVAAAAK